MGASLRFDVVTIFPQMLDGVLGESMLKRALDAGLFEIGFTNPRDFTHDTHRTVDDRPYGGGPGMVMKPEPIFDAVESIQQEGSRVVLMTPQGRPFTHEIAEAFSREKHIVLICGHYEGVDERIREALVTDEISIGDYVLTSGVLPAAVVIDATVRLLPGVLGAEDATHQESFTGPLLEYPQYTRPAVYRSMEVPDILVSGNHEEIARWREEKALERTRKRRPDLL